MNLCFKLVGSCLLAGGIALPASVQAQCATCPQPCAQPTVAYSPVVYQTTTVRQGWYPGRFLDRIGNRMFGPPPAATQTTYYRPTVPMTYTAGYAPTAFTQTVARPIALAPCASCSCSPCSCVQQTTYRPVTLAAVGGCSTCYSAPACDTCSTNATSYSYAPSSSGCSTCGTGYASAASYDYAAPAASTPQPSLGAGEGTPPPTTFRKEPTLAPAESDTTSDLGADETSSNGTFQPPKLWNPRDRVTLNTPGERSGTPVWQAVYRQPVDTQQVSQPQPSSGELQWVAGR